MVTTTQWNSELITIITNIIISYISEHKQLLCKHKIFRRAERPMTQKTSHTHKQEMNIPPLSWMVQLIWPKQYRKLTMLCFRQSIWSHKLSDTMRHKHSNCGHQEQPVPSNLWDSKISNLISSPLSTAAIAALIKWGKKQRGGKRKRQLIPFNCLNISMSCNED